MTIKIITRKKHKSHGSRKSRKSRKSHGSRKSRKSHASKETMKLSDIKKLPLTELQHQAKKHGIPFGGMTKNQIIEKIKRYVHKN